jgi:hypothetical protein
LGEVADESHAEGGIEIDFTVVQENAATPLAEIRASVLDILTTVLDIETSRLIVDIAANGVHDLVRARIQPTDGLDSRAAFEAAQLFVQQWSDPTSPLNKAVNNTSLFSIDPRGKQPLISFMVETAETVSSHANRGVLAASALAGIVATMFLATYVRSTYM